MKYRSQQETKLKCSQNIIEKLRFFRKKKNKVSKKNCGRLKILFGKSE